MNSPDNIRIDDIQIGNAGAMSWLLGIAAVLVAITVASWLRRRSRKRFATEDRIAKVFQLREGVSAFHVLHRSLMILALILLTLGLMDWRWGKTQREVPQKGIEIMFLLDVSRSMLAQDATPNRLERAKQMIRDMVTAMAGDRIGLVAFAGETRRITPLTNHYEDFVTALADVRPESLRRGGSRLGEAIEAGGDGFLSKTNSHRIMVVLTDGEDQESEPTRKAKQLHEQQGIRIFTIGLGDMSAGAKILDEETQRYLRYQGEPVVTKLNGKILEQVARATQGAYIPAGTKQVDMRAVYERYIAGIEQTEFDTVKIDAYEARFQWFAFPALILLMLETWMIGMGKKLASNPTQLRKDTVRTIASFFFLFMLGNIGQTAFAQGITGQSSPTQSSLSQSNNIQTIEDHLSAYNQGVVAYHNKDFEAAIRLFDHASRSSKRDVAAAARYNAGTARVSKAGAAIEKGEAEGFERELEFAIASLRSALRLRPRWEDARANLERAVRLMDQLSANGAQQNPGDAGEGQDQQDSPEQENGPDAPEETNSDQNGDRQSDNGNQESPNAEQDPTESDSSSEQPNNADQNGESPQEPTDSGSNSESTQKSANDSSDPQDDPGSETSDPDGSDPRDPPEGTLGTDAASENNEPNQDRQMATAVEPNSMTKEEAQKMLQAIRDRDMIRRFRQQQMNQTRQVPVEKDW